VTDRYANQQTQSHGLFDLRLSLWERLPPRPPQISCSTLGGGGNDKKDFIGASVTKSVKMNGHFNFHYDEYLRTIGPGRGYIPIAWAEKASQ
jgi:arabinogalactan endo-1,4-beta-galactosidase